MAEWPNTSCKKGRVVILPFSPPIDIEIGVLQENPLHLFHVSTLRGEVKTGGMHGKGVKKGDVLCLCEHGWGCHREI